MKILTVERGTAAFRAAVAKSKFKNTKSPFGETKQGHINDGMVSIKREDLWLLRVMVAVAGVAGLASRADEILVPQDYGTIQSAVNAVNGIASADADRDGFSNLEEYISGTDPTDPASFFRVNEVTPVPGTGMVLHWNAVDGRLYTVNWTASLTSPFFGRFELRFGDSVH